MAENATEQNTLPEPGQVVQFVGYSDGADNPIFEAGQMVRIERVNSADGSMVAVPVDGGAGDTLFMEEISMDFVDESTPVAAPVEEAVEATPVTAKAPKTKAGQAKDKAKGKTATPVAEAVVESRDLTVAEEDGGVRVADSAAVSLILSEQDALDAAKALVVQAEETYFTLGGVLAHIYYEGIFKAAGFSGKRGFADYVEQELGVQYRKAMYLIDIYVSFRKLGVDERRLTQIGWSKAKELTKYATPENFDELVDMAEDKTRDELVEHLRTTMVNGEVGGGEMQRRVSIKFVLHADQAGTVTTALDEAKQLSNNDDQSIALEYICAEWLSMSAGIEVPLEDEIRRINAKYGISLVVAGDDSAVEVA